MLKCDCKENAFFYEKTHMSDNKIYKTNIFKCGRFIEGSKKIKCNFYVENIIDVKEFPEPNESKNKEYKSTNMSTIINNLDKLKIENKNQTNNLKKYYLDKLKNLLDFYYDENKTNFFGKLNFILSRLNLESHEPLRETFTELKERINKNINKKIIINSNTGTDTLNYNEKEFDIYDHKYDIYKDFIKNYKNDEYFNDVLKIKKLKKKIYNRNKTKNVNNNSKKLFNSFIIQEEEETEVVDEEHKIKKEILSDEDDDEDNDEDNDNELKENEFDVDNLSEDDDIDSNQDYDEFSD